MRLLCLALAAPLFGSHLAGAQETAKTPELPLATALLVEKFENYSKQVREEAEAKVATKRAEVLAVLERHLKDRTQAGDLDGAIAVRTLIEKWKAEDAEGQPSEVAGKESPWKPLLGKGADALAGWTYDADQQIAVEDGVLTIDTAGKKYTPLLYPVGKNVVLRAVVELDHGRSVKREQQGGVGFHLVSEEDGSEIGMVSCVLQGRRRT